jgi:hypothetical protein
MSKNLRQLDHKNLGCRGHRPWLRHLKSRFESNAVQKAPLIEAGIWLNFASMHLRL